MGEVIVITSGKGGVGKTTTSANIGTGLAKAGHSVVMIDTDIGLRNLDVVLGMENQVMYNLVDVTEGSCTAEQALIADKEYANLFLLPSAQTRDKTAVSPQQMIKLTEELKPVYDYIILDCPAGIEQGFKNAIAAADRAIVVTTPEVSAVRDADRVLHLLEDAGIRERHLLVNRVRANLVRRGEMMAASDIEEILGAPLIGVIPDDENVLICNNQGTAVIGTGYPAGQAYENIAARITGKDVPFMDLDKKTGFWEKLFHRS